ncbi:unnamed protein product [Protopolystoma xenopodis]|uniref:Major facilitator superfamily (MFS) profile domain-containing protein n=1 Tax=Protopolystoma xenopodis TaxID=117903 RepID=A0A3S5B6S8_9PLAT|nr:unnamed protein product [Protopolystoma xenopodis]
MPQQLLFYRAICIAWCIVWFLFIFDLPIEDPWITQAELTLLPKYESMGNSKIGLFSAIPHILKVLFSYISGCIADALMINGLMTVTQTRKFMTGFSYSVFSLVFLILIFVDNGKAAITLLCVGVGLSGLATGGWMVNHLDLAPELSGVLAGLSMSTGTLGAVLSPLITGIITQQPVRFLA